MGILTDLLRELPLSAILREKLQELEKKYNQLEEENRELKDRHSEPNFIRKLMEAENHFLEVLIKRFTLEKTERGNRLTVYFDDKTPAIWMRCAKEIVKREIPNFDDEAFHIQREIDDFFREDKSDPYKFTSAAFSFRFCSGGTLPIIRVKGKQYFCLFYRDIDPIGWNIANGGCDSRNELLYPLDTIEREFCEELIILDLKKEIRYAFPSEFGKHLDHPDFRAARRCWEKLFPQYLISKFSELPIEITWIGGPDELVVHDGPDYCSQHISGVFLNINAKDFGIEVDKIAIIDLEGQEILLDGEVSEYQLVNRIVGLFELEKIKNDLRVKKDNKFIPDIFFYNGQKYQNNRFEEIRHVFIDETANIRSKEEREYYIKTKNKKNLCPVTKNILTRYLNQGN